MSDPAQSFLLPDGDNSLPGFPARPFFTELESRGDFTGERLFQQRPDTYKSVVVLLGQGVGVIRIGKLLQVSPNTVMAVRDREGATIELVKQHMASIANNGATLAGEMILEALNARAKNSHMLEIKELKELAVIYGIMTQNGQLLAGQPTARVELTSDQKPQHDDFNRYIAGLPTAGTDSAAEKSAQKEGANAGIATPIAGPGASAPVIDVPPVRTDSQSDGSPA